MFLLWGGGGGGGEGGSLSRVNHSKTNKIMQYVL